MLVNVLEHLFGHVWISLHDSDVATVCRSFIVKLGTVSFKHLGNQGQVGSGHCATSRRSVLLD